MSEHHSYMVHKVHVNHKCIGCHFNKYSHRGYHKHVHSRKYMTISREKTKQIKIRSKDDKKLPFLTNFRANVLLSTSICILAVDFAVFPRRFAKTETFGYGLMDAGVGSFIFLAGFLAPEAKNQIQ